MDELKSTAAQCMNIAAELEERATEELAHALMSAGQIDYQRGMQSAVFNPLEIHCCPQNISDD